MFDPILSVNTLGYTRIAGNFVKYYAQKKNWSDARASCQAEGADLITISSKETIDWLANRVVWTGANDRVRNERK